LDEAQGKAKRKARKTNSLEPGKDKNWQVWSWDSWSWEISLVWLAGLFKAFKRPLKNHLKAFKGLLKAFRSPFNGPLKTL
jgi:hypothetical protein